MPGLCSCGDKGGRAQVLLINVRVIFCCAVPECSEHS